MSGLVSYAVGFVAFPAMVALAFGAYLAQQRVGTFFAKRAARPFLSVLLGRIDNYDRRISLRALIATPILRGRSWLVVVVKEGPNEPVAARDPSEGRGMNPPFTEPLDDEDDEA